MSFGSSSSVYPTASSAASFAIGKPVAFDASADERETRGFISISCSSLCLRLVRELDVRAPRGDADGARAREGGVAEPLQLAVGERLLRRHRPRVAGVDADRIEVLDRADDDAVAGRVDDDLELELLPALERALDEDLTDWARSEAVLDPRPQLLARSGDPAAAAAERERGPDDRRYRACVQLLERGDDDALGHRQAGGGHRRPEERAVLGRADRVQVGADQLDRVLAEDAALRQLDREVQRRLAAEGGEERVRPLAGDDLGQRRRIEGLQIGRVGPFGVGHDRGRVRVREHDPVALGAAARGTPGHRRSRTRSPGRSGSARSRRSGCCEGRFSSARRGDPVEEGDGVVRPGRGLGMELERLEAVAAEALRRCRR